MSSLANYVLFGGYGGESDEIKKLGDMIIKQISSYRKLDESGRQEEIVKEVN